MLGTIRFRATSSFTGTTIRMVRAELRRGGQFEALTTTTSVELKPTPCPDFDGDTEVGFRDFILFAEKFGAKEGDGRYEARYDLEEDGAINFKDFLIFSENFGKECTTGEKGDRITDVSPGSGAPGTLIAVSGVFAAGSEYTVRFGATTVPAIAVQADRITTKDVGTKLPNPWGLYDMHGNVWELSRFCRRPWSSGVTCWEKTIRISPRA